MNPSSLLLHRPWPALLLGLGLVLTAAVRGAGPSGHGTPNLLILLSDDMGYGDLGCYGSTQVPTPNLDRLAAGGIRCTDGYVCANICAPSRAGLLTGRYPQRFGFEHNLNRAYANHRPEELGIPAGQKTIADRLKAAGYRTALVGKWHVGEAVPEMLPNARGFDFFFGMLNGSHDYFPTPERNHLWRNDQPVSQIRIPYLTDWFTEEAIDFMRAEGAAGRRWFLYLSYSTPHTPLQAKEEDLRAFAGIEHRGRRTYCAMQRCMDLNIGRIIRMLEQTGQLDDTLIVFFSDNGGSVNASQALNAPLNGMKGTFLEGGVRVPFIWHWPKGLPGGITYRHPFISLDLLPTFLAAAGARMPEEWEGTGNQRRPVVYDGVNLLPFLRGERGSDRPHDTLYWRMTLRGAAIRDGDWKLLVNVHTPPMLFNLAEDISEQTNLYLQQPDRARVLWEKLNAWEESLEDVPHWMEEPYWQGYNRKLYERSYRLTQPGSTEWDP